MNSRRSVARTILNKNRVEQGHNSLFLGIKGESRFQELCSDAHLVCNKSTQDQTGWDYIIEHQFYSTDSKIRLDQQPEPIKMFIQVKTIRSSSSVFEISLSAAQRLAQRTSPCFIAVFIVENKTDFTGLYIIHVYENILESFLRKLREEEAKSTLNINKVTLKINFKKLAQRIDLNGDQMKGELEKSCGTSYAKYCKEKAHRIETLGYTARRYEMSMTLDMKDNKEVGLFFLGLKQAVVHDLIIEERRWEISLLDSSSDTAVIQVNPKPVDTCRVYLRHALRDRPLSLNANIFATPGFLKKEHRVIRICTKWLDIFISNDKWTFQAPGDDVQKRKFTGEEFLEISHFYKIVSKDCWHISIMLKSRKPILETLNFSLISENPSMTEDRMQYAVIINKILRDYNGSLVKFTSKELHDNKEHIDLLESLINKPQDANFGWRVNRIDNPQCTSEVCSVLLSEKECAIITHIEFEEFYISYYALADFDAVETGAFIELSFNNLKMREIDVLSKTDEAIQTFTEVAKHVTGVNLFIDRSTKLDGSA